MKISEEEARRRLSSRGNLAGLRLRAATQPSVTSPNTEILSTDNFNANNSEAVTRQSQTKMRGPDQPLISPSKEIIRQAIEHKSIERGRGHKLATPEFLRDIMGGLASIPGAGTQRQIAEEFGVCHQAVSQYKSGEVGGVQASQARSEKVKERLDTIKDTALTKLMSALDLCGDEKLADLSAKELGRFANDMAKVVTSVSPQAGNDGPTVQVTIYAPQAKTEGKYKVVDV